MDYFMQKLVFCFVNCNYLLVCWSGLIGLVSDNED